LDKSYYAVQFDTSRDLVANNNPEGVTGLYAIFNSLSKSKDLDANNQIKFNKSSLHTDYPIAIVSVYLVFFTAKQNIAHHRQIISRVDAYLLIQEFKQRCFEEISSVLQVLLPEDGFEWRFEK